MHLHWKRRTKCILGWFRSIESAEQKPAENARRSLLDLHVVLLERHAFSVERNVVVAIERQAYTSFYRATCIFSCRSIELHAF